MEGELEDRVLLRRSANANPAIQSSAGLFGSVGVLERVKQLFGGSERLPGEPSRRPEWARVVRLVVVVLLGLTLVGFVLALFYQNVVHGLMWALGLHCAGLFVGFLFALPRVWPSPAAAPRRALGGEPVEEADTEPPGSETSSRAARPPDSLLEIADWLTKIIVGLGLVNLKQVPDLMNRLAVQIAGGADHSKSVALAMAIFFPIVGVLLAYLITRLYLQSALIRGDRSALHEATSPFVAEYEANKTAAQQLSLEGTLRSGTASPSDASKSILAELNAQYANVNVPDYRQRVLRKNAITDLMYTTALKDGVSKGWLASQAGDGYVHVLANWALAHPSAEDVDLLLRRGHDVFQKHTKFRVAEAFRRLAEAGMIPADRKEEVDQLLASYLDGADASLRGQVEAARRSAQASKVAKSRRTARD